MPNPRPTDVLRAEHELLLAVLACLDRHVRDSSFAEEGAVRRGRRLLKFLSGFGDVCHHGKEEHVLAPVLLRLGFSQNEGLLAGLQQERNRGRREQVLLETELDACAAGDERACERFGAQASSFSFHLREQIAHEERELFPAVEKVLDPDAEEALLRAFATYEGERVGHGTIERQLGAARELCAGARLSFPESAAQSLGFWRRSRQRA